MVQHVAEGEKIIKGNNIDDFGKLLHSAWLTKKKLSTHSSYILRGCYFLKFKSLS